MIFHKVWLQWRVVALLFKTHSRLLSNRTIENETEQQKGEAPVIYYKYAVALFFTLVTFDDSPRMIHPKCSKVGRRQPLSSIVFNYLFFMNGLNTLVTLVIYAKLTKEKRSLLCEPKNSDY
jgi:hypothetical protein